jgi:hypothetical protein
LPLVPVYLANIAGMSILTSAPQGEDILCSIPLAS